MKVFTSWKTGKYEIPEAKEDNVARIDEADGRDHWDREQQLKDLGQKAGRGGCGRDGAKSDGRIATAEETER